MPEPTFYRHTDKPTLQPKLGTLTGKIPNWLNGTLTRNGSGIRRVGNDEYKHLFDGLAVIHRFHIENEKVTYNSRALESEAYLKAMAAERIVVSEFGTLGIPDPCNSLFAKFKSLFIEGTEKPLDDDRTDNCGVNVGYYGDQLYAMTETVFTRQINPETLETVGGRTRIGDYVTVNGATAHPHVLSDGSILNMGSNFRHAKGPHYCIIKVPPTYESSETSFKDAKLLAEIPMSSKFYPSYFHSFGMTEDKIIFIEQPLSFSVPRMLVSNYLWRTSIKDWLGWWPNSKTKFHVVCLKTGKIHPIVYETDELFTFHHANAYEEDGQLIVDVVGYNDAKFVIDSEQGEFGTKNHSKAKRATATLRRYVLPLDASHIHKPTSEATMHQSTATARAGNSNVIDVTPATFYDDFIEFPRINYKFNGLKYEFVYGATSSARKGEIFPAPNQITKVSMVTGKSVVWTASGETMVSEPIFVSNPTISNAKEDDGVILANLLHQNEPEKTTLVILNAKDMTEVGLVTFVADGVVTATLHGLWAQTGDKVHTY